MDIGKLALAQQVQAELERRQNERALQDYRPRTDPQRRFHDSPAFIRVMSGSNVSGKTTALVAEACAVALGYRPWTGEVLESKGPPRVMLCGASFTHAADQDLVPFIEKFLPPSQILPGSAGRARLANGRVHKWTLKTGGVLKLMSYDQDPTEFEGTKWTLIGFNEPPPRTLWAACLRGAVKGAGRIAFAATPCGSDSAWMVNELFEKADGKFCEVITADMDAGHSFLTPEEIAQFKEGLDPDEYEARVHGRPQSLTGRVYKQFDEGIHVLRGDAAEAMRRLVADPTVPKGLVVDPHDRRPFFCAWFLVTPENELVFFAEHPEGDYSRMKSSNLDVEDYHDLFTRFEDDRGFRPVWQLMDPNFGVQRRVVSLESIRDKFDTLGRCFETNIVDSIQDGHTAVKLLLNERRLFVLESCPNIIRGFRFYCWKDQPDATGLVVPEKVSEVGKDPMDCVRYAAMADVRYFDPTFRPKAEVGQLVP
jgi:hypothetical protein